MSLSSLLLLEMRKDFWNTVDSFITFFYFLFFEKVYKINVLFYSVPGFRIYT